MRPRFLGRLGSRQGSRSSTSGSLLGALSFAAFVPRRRSSLSSPGSSAPNLPMPRPQPLAAAAPWAVVVDKGGAGWVRLGSFTAARHDFCFHSNDRLGVRVLRPSFYREGGLRL